jgi:hypothetical protein
MRPAPRSWLPWLLLGLALLFCATSAWAGTPEDLGLAKWVLVPGAKGSTVEATRLVFRNDSRLQYPDLNKEVSEITIDAEWIDPSTKYEMTLEVVVKYDDSASENLTATFPKGSPKTQLVVRPKWWHGRVVKNIEMYHARGMTTVAARRVRVSVEHVAVFIDSSVLGSAKLNPGDSLRGNIIVIKGNTATKKCPYLSNIKAEQITVVAAASSQMNSRSDLMLKLYDSKGKCLKTLSKDINGNVREYTFSLKGIDLSQVDRVVFEPGVNHLVIRKIAL